MKRNNKWIAALALILCFGLLAGCAKQEQGTVPGDALLSGTPQLIGVRDYVSGTETQLTMTMTDAYRDVAKADFAILDAVSFPESQEDGVIAAGYVTKAQLAKIISADRKIVTAELRGEQILTLADRNVGYLLAKKDSGKSDARYVHFSGVAFVYNKKLAEGSRIVDHAAADKNDPQKTFQLDYDAKYTVAMNSGTAERLYPASETTEIAGSELDAFCGYLVKPEKGISSNQIRFADKADLDSPKIVTVILIVVGVVAVAAVVLVYVLTKKRQKRARVKRGGEPRIDV